MVRKFILRIVIMIPIMLFGCDVVCQNISEFIDFYSDSIMVSEYRIVDSLRKTERYEETILHINLIEDSVPHKAVMQYAKSKSYSELGLLDSAKVYFDLSIQNCLILSHSSISRDSLALIKLDELYASDVVDSLMSAYSSFLHDYRNASNVELLEVLDKLYDNDQEGRQLFTSYLLGESGNETVDSINNLIDKADSKNQLILRTIIDEYGWPGYSAVGYKGDNRAFYIVQHSDLNLKFQEFGLKTILEEYNCFNTSGQNVAMLTDRYLINKGKSQIFGTQFRIEAGEFGRNVIPKSMVHSYELTDFLRAKFGLESMEKYIERASKRYIKK